MSSNVTIRFDAETQQFQSNVDGATKSVAKSAEAVVNAKNQIVASYKLQIAAAKDVGASADELSAIQRRSAQMIASVTEQNATRVINALDRISTKQKAVAKEIENLNSVAPASGGKKSPFDEFTSNQKSAGLMRELSGGLSLRTAEVFARAIPGFGAVADVAFPVVGVMAFTGEVIKGVAALHTMYEEAEKIPTAIAEGFDSLNAPLMTSVDTLHRTNDELAISIAHLEHKPANTLSLALDEARINADRLAQSATKATNDVIALFKANHVGLASAVFTAQDTTGTSEDEIQQRMEHIRNLERDNRTALHAPGADPDSEAAKNRTAAIRREYESLYTWAETRRKQFAEGGKYEQANTNLFAGVQDYAGLMLDQQDSEQRNADLTVQQKKDQDAERQKQQAEASARKLTEAQKKAAEEKLKGMQAYVVTWEMSGTATAKAIFDYWEKQKSQFVAGSDQFNSIQTKQQEIAKTGAERIARAFAEARAGNTQGAMDLLTGHKEAKPDEGKAAYDAGQKALSEWRTADAKQAVEVGKAQAKASMEKAQEEARNKLAAISLDARTGRMSAGNAASATAKVHSDEYDQQMAQLQANLDAAKKTARGDTTVDVVNAQAAIAKATSDRTVQVMEDAANKSATTWKGALNGAFDDWYQHANDTAGMVSGLFKQGVNGLNDNLVNMMTGDYRRGDWKQYGHQMFKSAASDMLQKSEAKGLAALGINPPEGKPDGSSAKPFHVIMAAAGAAASGIGKLFGGNSGDGSGSDDSGGGFMDRLKSVFSSGGDGSGSGDGGGGGIGGFFKSVFGAMAGSFQGGKALGGGVNASGIFDVGEMGRERVFLPQGSYVQPHNQMGGGNVYYHVSVADGVTPEQMDMHLRAALQEYHPHAVRASVAAMQDQQQRSPRR